MNKIFIVTFVAVTMLFSFNLSAQQDNHEFKREGHFDREAFEAKRNAFITAEVGLTPEEASEFIPLCDQLRQKRFEVGKESRRLSREIGRKKGATSEEYNKAIDMYLDASIKEAELEKEYYKKFKEILSPEKLYKYRNAELKFARHFMRNPENMEHRKEDNQKRNKK